MTKKRQVYRPSGKERRDPATLAFICTVDIVQEEARLALLISQVIRTSTSSLPGLTRLYGDKGGFRLLGWEIGSGLIYRLQGCDTHRRRSELVS